jgi:hypothetical protein
MRGRFTSIRVVVPGFLLLAGGLLLILGRGSSDVDLPPGFDDSRQNIPADSERVTSESVNRRSAARTFALEVTSEGDGRPIKGASVHVQSELAAASNSLVTDRDGVAHVSTSGRSGVSVEVLARGYAPWSGSCEPVNGKVRVALIGLAAIRLTPVGSFQFPDEATVSLRPVGVSGAAPVSVGVDLLPDGSASIGGLRPQSPYEMSVHVTGASISLSRHVVHAGWPEATVVHVYATPLIGHIVELRGVLQGDCERLRVALVSSGGRRVGVAPTWDPVRRVAVATPGTLGGGRTLS